MARIQKRKNTAGKFSHFTNFYCFFFKDGFKQFKTYCLKIQYSAIAQYIKKVWFGINSAYKSSSSANICFPKFHEKYLASAFSTKM